VILWVATVLVPFSKTAGFGLYRHNFITVLLWSKNRKKQPKLKHLPYLDLTLLQFTIAYLWETEQHQPHILGFFLHAF